MQAMNTKYYTAAETAATLAKIADMERTRDAYKELGVSKWQGIYTRKINRLRKFIERYGAVAARGDLCADCQGTGKDSAKTEAYKLAHPGASGYVRCWTCNGNGVAPIYPSSGKTQA